MSGLRGSGTLVLRPVDELSQHASRVRPGLGTGTSRGAFSGAARAWGRASAEVSAVQGLDFHKWLQRRPEDVRRLVAGAFSGVPN